MCSQGIAVQHLSDHSQVHCIAEVSVCARARVCVCVCVCVVDCP